MAETLIRSAQPLASSAETWCDITGYEGFYAVSDKYRVCSLERTVNANRPNAPTMRVRRRILKPQRKPGSTLDRVTLCDRNGQHRTHYIGKLVREHFQ